jgi:hypothetical protein
MDERDTEEEEKDRKRKGWGMLIFGIVLLCLQLGIRKLGGQIKHLSLNERPLKLPQLFLHHCKFSTTKKISQQTALLSSFHCDIFQIFEIQKKIKSLGSDFLASLNCFCYSPSFVLFFFFNPIRSAHASNLFVLWPTRHLFNLCSPASSIRTSASNSPGHAVPTKPIRLIVLPYIRISDFSSQTGVKIFYDYSYLPALSTVYQSKENNVDRREKIPIDR